MLDQELKNFGSKLSMTTFFSAWVLLSVRIYKIRTLLSTGFVDNQPFEEEAPRRKALSGAAFGGTAGLHWEVAQ
jgi:hypothetical protein